MDFRIDISVEIDEILRIVSDEQKLYMLEELLDQILNIDLEYIDQLIEKEREGEL